jgi:hypothetical protein
MIEFDCVLDYNYPGVTVKPEAWKDPDIFPLLLTEPFVSSGDERYSNTLGEGDGGAVLSNRAHEIKPQNLEKRVSAMIDLLYNCKPEQVSKNRDQMVELCKRCMRAEEAYLAAILRIALINSRDRNVPEEKIISIETGTKRDVIKNTLKTALEKFSYSEVMDMLDEIKRQV